MKRKWITPLDLCATACILAVILTLFLLQPKDVGDTVSVYVGDAIYAEFSLSDAPDTYTVPTEKGSLTLAFSEDGVSAVSSDCHDRICVRTGKISRVGESIVCAPLGVCVQIGESTIDGVTG